MCLLNCQAKHFKGFESCKRVASWALCSVQVWFTLAAQQPVRNGPRLFSLISEANQKCSWWGLFKSDVNSNTFLEMSGNVLFMRNVSNCREIVLEVQRACRQFRKTRISSCLCLFIFFWSLLSLHTVQPHKALQGDSFCVLEEIFQHRVLVWKCLQQQERIVHTFLLSF